MVEVEGLFFFFRFTVCSWWISKCDAVIIPSDLNAKLGKEVVCADVTGKYILNEETNINVEMLCEYAFANNVILMSTQF